MTTAYSIMTDAFRETNLIPMGNLPNTNQQTEALSLLNRIIISTVGNEAGDGLDDINIGGKYDQSMLCSEFIPNNARLLLNLTSPASFCLDPQPFEGQRLNVVDVKGTLSTYNLTIKGGGRNIEGVPNLVLNVDADKRQWMYRADTGNWVKITSLLIDDEMPFPIEFDDYFITMLAMRLNPRYGQTVTGETAVAMKRSRNLLRARYHAWKEIRSDLDPRGLTNPGYYTSLDGSEFNSGRTYPWR